VLCCAVLCFAVLCCAVLCCAVLCCAVLCCAVQPQGLLKAEGGLQPSLLIDSSTILPTYTQKLASTIATYSLLAPGARKVPGSESPVFVDAPVSGGVPGAVAASLTFMVGHPQPCCSQYKSASAAEHTCRSPTALLHLNKQICGICQASARHLPGSECADLGQLKTASTQHVGYDKVCSMLCGT
jgi:hypothetical protein